MKRHAWLLVSCTLSLMLILAGCSGESSKSEEEEYCESLGTAGKHEYALRGHCLNAADAEQARIERENCQRNSATCPPTPRPTVTPAASDVFRLWYAANGYPASAFDKARSIVDQACRSLRDGLSGESVVIAIMAAAEPSETGDILYIVGAGVQALCPDQSHKFR